MTENQEPTPGDGTAQPPPSAPGAYPPGPTAGAPDPTYPPGPTAGAPDPTYPPGPTGGTPDPAFPPGPSVGGTPPPGGPGTPPPYGTPPPGAPGYGYAPAGASDERTWVLVAHFGGAIATFLSGGTLGWVPPLVAMTAKGSQSGLVRAHAVEALNFQLTWTVATLIAWVLTVCTVGVASPLIFITIAVGVIFGIVAGVKASNGDPYRYPVTVRAVK